MSVMDSSRWIAAVTCTVVLSISLVLPFIRVSSAAPITIDFNTCQPAAYQQSPDPSAPLLRVSCCPLKPSESTNTIEGLPPPSTKHLRMRRASQCTDERYAAQLAKGYELMRALPDDDPRSLQQQWYLHCSYCGASFQTPLPDGNTTGIDIHFSWLFFPWHRHFLYFHERILQKLLDDPTFSLNYWNWDNPFTVEDVDGSHHGGICLKAGSDFPKHLYGVEGSASFDPNRSASAKGQGRLHFPDFTFSPALPAVEQKMYNASSDDLIASNLNVIYQALVSGGTTQETFLGRPYRQGFLQGNPSAQGGAGTLEATAHAGVHFWTGQDPPVNTNDMGALAFSARDPIFFAHHSNIDRLWQVWLSLGPFLGQQRSNYNDSDYLDASFLFYDENKDLRRVKVWEALDTKNMGFVYQEANDAAWMFATPSKCSNLSYTSLLAEAEAVPVPVPDAKGMYHLEAGKPFIIIVDRPDNPHGVQEFLTITGIKLDRFLNAGFDVFVDLLYPYSYSVPWKCAEYSGRFTNMAMTMSMEDDHSFTWQQSITKTLMDIGADPPPSKLVITLLPLSVAGMRETITFTSISVTQPDTHES